MKKNFLNCKIFFIQLLSQYTNVNLFQNSLKYNLMQIKNHFIFDKTTNNKFKIDRLILS